jgi:hypothetical protein
LKESQPSADVQNSSPRLVLSVRSKHLFSHFEYPIGGIQSALTRTVTLVTGSGRDAKAESNDPLPDVLPIRLLSDTESNGRQSENIHSISQVQGSGLENGQEPLECGFSPVRLKKHTPNGESVSLANARPIAAQNHAESVSATGSTLLNARKAEDSNVIRFLREIPDYSYMLSTTLSLPKSR